MRVRAEELYFKSDGERLFFRAWETAVPRGHAVLLHGLGEHSGRLARPAGVLQAAGLDVAAYDLRGHGRSSGGRGDLAGFDAHLRDLTIFLRVLEDQGRRGPRFLVGHGVGALVVVQQLLKRPETECAGAVLTSPALRLRVEPRAATLAAARVLARAAPALELPTDVRPAHLTRDPRAAREVVRDPLVHRRTTARAFLATLAAMEEARRLASRITQPLLVLGGLEDALVSPQAMREFVAAVGSRDRRLVLFPRLYHDLFHEVDRVVVLEEVERWVSERI
ncbi:MAG: alpha/beta fold hydrolase [Gemmatimonadota bacterium]